MEFALPDDHLMVRETVREVCLNEIEPVTEEIDADGTIPADILDRLAALDLLGIPFDTVVGGLGGDTLMSVLVAEELGRVSGSIGHVYGTHVALGASPIDRDGTAENKRRWLEPLASGESLGTWAVSEAERAGTPATLETTAERRGDGWVLDGTKQFVTNASVADTMLVSAVTDSDAISTFVVDADDEGLEVSRTWDTLGLTAAKAGEVTLEGVRLPADRLLGEVGSGWQRAMRALDDARLMVAAVATGVAQGAFDAVSAARSQTSGEDHAQVEMHRAIERARLLTYRGARSAETSDRVTRDAALAKLDASETAREVASDAIQLLGQDGYARPSAPRRQYRDGKALEIVAGTNQRQRAVLGRELDR